MVICAYVLCVRLRDKNFRTQKMVWKCKIVENKKNHVIFLFGYKNAFSSKIFVLFLPAS